MEHRSVRQLRPRKGDLELHSPPKRPPKLSPVRSPVSPLSTRMQDAPPTRHSSSRSNLWSPRALYRRLVPPRTENDKPSVIRISTAIVAASAVLLVASTLVFLLVLFIRWDPLKSEHCNSAACNQFAKLLNNSIDWSGDPCRNFDAYVCSRWRSKRKYSVRTELVVRAIDAMTNVVSKDVQGTSSPGQDFLQKVSLFYRSCDIVWRGDRDELPVIREFLLRAGIVWPRRPGTPDVLRTLLSLSVELDWPVIIQIVPWKKGVWMRLPLSLNKALTESRLLSDMESKMRSFNFLKTKFSAGDSTGAVNFSDTDKLESAFFQPLADLATIGAAEELDSRSLEKNKWMKLLEQWNVTAAPSFFTDSPKYVKKFLDLWKREGEARTHLFVSWMAVRYVSLFANRDLVSNFYRTTNPETIMYLHGRTCYALVYKFIGDYLFAPYNTQVFLPVRADVERIVSVIRNKLAAHLSSTPPFSNETSAKFQWASLDVVMKALNQTAHHSANATSAADELLPDMNNSLTHNWHAAWQASRYGKASSVPYTLGWETIMSMSPYTHLRDDFVLAPYVLSFPLYDPNLVDAVKYGAFGAVVAKASAQMAIKHYGGAIATAQAVDDARTCVKSYARDATSTLLDLASLNILADAFEEHGSRGRLAVVERFTASQLLFVSWCFQKCRGQSEALGDECNAAVRHVAAFSSAFGCSQGDPLNPEKKCTLF
ncbi:uncharacterized protein LOC142563750 isoform X2 [Dermacentor variabilis]|uniref:uncharacterized protein LOC142563750 isoform X2 n=1 Tax=Dermacentor variabilis TaxID=34621 RepID=UPI003F5B8330